MEIKNFAAKHRLRARELDGELVVLCKGYKAGKRDYSHIYRYNDRLFGAIYLGTARTWGNARKAALNVACIVAQDGNNEGTILFDPSDVDQVKTVLEWWEAKRKRRVSPEQAARMAERLARARLNR